ncbi:universal stress protein [Pontibacter arcticus]|uniref:Universal stress protein n=1 Tax=Pontibacter arcticus TaxID=2080288 RepID=A0A364RC73_9BACT|nr:universal stress protein [Pontibacter arcticus]RAU81883.1 universal stress protein [Pontibacter arcticus]
MRKILVPTDFSEESKNAYEVALAIARKINAEIVLLHTIEMPYNSTFSTTGENTSDGMEQVYMLHLLENVKRDMNKFKNAFPYEGLHVTEAVDVSRLHSKVNNLVQEQGIDLIVMGSKGASGLQEILIGSNTEKVVRTATCPVLTVKDRQQHFEPREIVVASDFKREIKGAMQRFKSLQEMFGAKLHLVYVNTPSAFENSLNLQQRLVQLAEDHNLQNYSVNIFNDVTEEDGILHFAYNIKADLIMMATHGRTGLSHLLSGSIAEDIVNHTTTPVLTFHLR